MDDDEKIEYNEQDEIMNEINVLNKKKELTWEEEEIKKINEKIKILEEKLKL